MKELYKYIALIATLVLTLTVGLIVYKLSFTPTVWLSTESPNKTYTVELTGDKGRGGFIIPSVVRFNVIKNGRTVVYDAFAHSGDSMDISFELAYPEHAWISENVLRFWRNPDRREDNGSDSLLILNDTGKAVKYLRLNAKDMFLVFDMQPNSTMKLSPSRQAGPSWVTCEGEFEDGQHITCNGVNFSPENKLNEPLKYCVTVGYSRVTIASPQTTGYDVNGNWKTPNVPKATDCNP